MMSSATVGFGDATKGKATTMGNPYALLTTIPRDGGFDLVVSAKGGAATEGGERTVTLRFREDHGPRVGERVMVRHRLVKVAGRRYDQAGRLQIMDEDTGTWEPWPE